MGTLILLAIIFVFVWPLVKAIWRGWNMHRQWKKATQGMRDAFEKARQGAQQPPQPPKKKKKIDPTVGEYVAFEEIKVTTTTTETTDAAGRTTVRTESQVEDAVWEEITVNNPKS